MNFSRKGLAVADYLNEYRRLSKPLLQQISEGGYSPDPSAGGGDPSYMGGQADLTPIKNKAREAVEALSDAIRACDSGRAEDAQEAMRRARAVIDAALGGGLGSHGAAVPPTTSGGYGKY
jgi:hypothetical protein